MFESNKQQQQTSYPSLLYMYMYQLNIIVSKKRLLSAHHTSVEANNIVFYQFNYYVLITLT